MCEEDYSYTFPVLAECKVRGKTFFISKVQNVESICMLLTYLSLQMENSKKQLYASSLQPENFKKRSSASIAVSTSAAAEEFSGRTGGGGSRRLQKKDADQPKRSLRLSCRMKCSMKSIGEEGQGVFGQPA